MKRIVLSCRVNFTLRGKEEKKVFTFEKGQPYEVEDAVANHAFIKERLVSVENVLAKAPEKSKSKSKEPKAEPEEAANVESSIDD